MKWTAIVVAALPALSGCATVPEQPSSAQDVAAMGRAGEMLWTVEAENGARLGSATAYGPGRLLASASAVENWVGHRLQVRQGTTVLPVSEMRFAVSQNFALLHVQAPNIERPATSARPSAHTRLAMAGSNAGNVFTGVGNVVPVSSSMAGIPGINDVVVAELPAARGFSGAPVVTEDGRLVGIVSNLLHRQYFDRPIPGTVMPGTSIPRRAMTVLPIDIIQRTMLTEGLN